MDDKLFDNVKALLAGDFGDDQILKQIHRACKNNEVISNYEKKYVRDLAERYLVKGSLEAAPEPASYVPAVKILESPVVESRVAAVGQQQQQPVEPMVQHSDDDGGQSTGLVSSHLPSSLKTARKNTRIIAAVAAVAALVVISAVAYALSDPSDVGTGEDIIPLDTPDPPPVPDVLFDVSMDLAEYSGGDLISISGASDNADNVALAVENPAGMTIWEETVQARAGGTYSTLTIAGGPGWDEYGTYTLHATSSDGMSDMYTFDLVP